MAVGYDQPRGKAVYAIDNFPDDYLFWRIGWIGGVGNSLRGGSGFFAETATNANPILCKYHRSTTALGFGGMSWNRGAQARPSELGYGGVQTVYPEGKANAPIPFGILQYVQPPAIRKPGVKAAVATFGQITLTSVSSRVMNWH